MNNTMLFQFICGTGALLLAIVLTVILDVRWRDEARAREMEELSREECGDHGRRFIQMCGRGSRIRRGEGRKSFPRPGTAEFRKPTMPVKLLGITRNPEGGWGVLDTDGGITGHEATPADAKKLLDRNGGVG